MRYTVRPLSDRTWIGQTKRKPATFRARWDDTQRLLLEEIELLKGRDVVLECDVREQDIGIRGGLLTSAKPATPAIVVAFESAHGSLMYRCDRFYTNWSHQMPDWQANVRAIALTLQALRAVDRYAATETGQQYAGFKALPAGRAMPASHMTSDEAWSILGSFGEQPIEVQRMAGDDALRAAHKAARKFAHPDRHNGDQTLWDQVEQAAAVLGLVS
jgi:hypothetical protein